MTEKKTQTQKNQGAAGQQKKPDDQNQGQKGRGQTDTKPGAQKKEPGRDR
jgi:hypothetical protein